MPGCEDSKAGVVAWEIQLRVATGGRRTSRQTKHSWEERYFLTHHALSRPRVVTAREVERSADNFSDVETRSSLGLPSEERWGSCVRIVCRGIAFLSSALSAFFFFQTETEYPTTLTNENLHYLFELPAKSVANTRPFFDCALTLTRFVSSEGGFLLPFSLSLSLLSCCLAQNEREREETLRGSLLARRPATISGERLPRMAQRFSPPLFLFFSFPPRGEEEEVELR